MATSGVGNAILRGTLPVCGTAEASGTEGGSVADNCATSHDGTFSVHIIDHNGLITAADSQDIDVVLTFSKVSGGVPHQFELPSGVTASDGTSELTGGRYRVVGVKHLRCTFSVTV